MNPRFEDISSILKEQIKNYSAHIEMKETGTVVTVGDGIARVYGLRSCMSNELLRFEDGSFGMAQNLETDTVSVAILSDKDSIREGSVVYRTGKALSVPVGEALLGRVVAGWASTVCIVCFMGGIQLLCLGVIGEYIGKIYMETKARPRYIISERTWQTSERRYKG